MEARKISLRLKRGFKLTPILTFSKTGVSKVRQLNQNTIQGGPLPGINAVKTPFKWPKKIMGFTGVISPQKSGELWPPTTKSQQHWQLPKLGTSYPGTQTLNVW